MKPRLAHLALVLASSLAPWHSCDAGDGTVTGDTRYKYSQRDEVPERAPESVKTAKTTDAQKTRRVARRWWRCRAHWYYARAGELPWWPNAPGD